MDNRDQAQSHKKALFKKSCFENLFTIFALCWKFRNSTKLTRNPWFLGEKKAF